MFVLSTVDLGRWPSWSRRLTDAVIDAVIDAAVDASPTTMPLDDRFGDPSGGNSWKA